MFRTINCSILFQLDGKCDTLSGLLEAINHPSANFTEKANFSFPAGVQGEGASKVSLLKSIDQLNLKVPNLPTVYFPGEGGRGVSDTLKSEI